MELDTAKGRDIALAMSPSPSEASGDGAGRVLTPTLHEHRLTLRLAVRTARAHRPYRRQMDDAAAKCFSFHWILTGMRRIFSADMKLILSTHNLKLTKGIEQHILERIDKLEHYDRWAVDARVIIENDKTKAPSKQFGCSIRLGVRGPDLFAVDHDADLYAAIDKVTKKIEQQIRKRHSKRKAVKHTDAALAKARRQVT